MVVTITEDDSTVWARHRIGAQDAARLLRRLDATAPEPAGVDRTDAADCLLADLTTAAKHAARGVK